MHCTRQITDSIVWVGGSDRRLALFENLFPLPRGVAYNSYLILDEKTALMDTVDSSITRQFLENILHTLNGRSLDYLVVNHMEPDHCASIEELLLRYPNLKVVGNDKTLKLIGQFYDMDLEGHTLHFYLTPMVHWPEVMMTFEEQEGILFSADAFGSFGALNGNIFNDELDFDRDWLPDARRYYSNIVGKYGPQVQAAMKKLAGLSIRMICPLHGPIWRSDLAYLLEKYDKWSRYEPEERAVTLIYGSLYGDTENAVNLLAAGLADAGVRNLTIYDASSTHVSTLIAEIFRCSHLVLATPTYNNGVYPSILNLLHDMQALNVQNRTVALLQNGSWAPAGGKLARGMLEGMKDMRILDPMVTIRSTLKEDSLSELEQLKAALLSSLNEN